MFFDKVIVLWAIFSLHNFECLNNACGRPTFCQKMLVFQNLNFECKRVGFHKTFPGPGHNWLIYWGRNTPLENKQVFRASKSRKHLRTSSSTLQIWPYPVTYPAAKTLSHSMMSSGVHSGILPCIEKKRNIWGQPGTRRISVGVSKSCCLHLLASQFIKQKHFQHP